MSGQHTLLQIGFQGAEKQAEGPLFLVKAEHPGDGMVEGGGGWPDSHNGDA